MIESTGEALTRRLDRLERENRWQPCKTQIVVEWCGHAQEYVPWREADAYWRMVPVLDEAS